MDFDKFRLRGNTALHWEICVRCECPGHRGAGLALENLWRGKEDRDEVFFIFAVADLNKARASISSPDAAVAAEMLESLRATTGSWNESEPDWQLLSRLHSILARKESVRGHRRP